MKNVLCLLIFLCFTLVCNGQNREHFKLYGEISNGYDGKVFFSRVFESSKDTTVIADNGHFLIEGNVVEPTLATLEYADKKFSFYIESGELNISISPSLPGGFKLIGSQTQIDKEELDKMNLSTISFQDSIWKIYAVKRKEADSPEKQRLGELMDSLNQEEKSVMIKFIKSHPNSFVSLDKLIYVDIDRHPIDTIRGWFNRFSDQLKECESGQRINKMLRRYEATKIAQQAPTFSTIGYNGEEIDLTSFKGKTVILEFWASWCVPCLESISHLKTVYQKYKNKGLVVIGISIDSDINKWVTGIKKHQLDIWPQALAIVNKESAKKGLISEVEIESKYPTSPIPRMLVIDPKGKIIKKWNGYGEEYRKEQDEFFENYFK